MTMGSRADYGFDPAVYHLREKPLPTMDQFQSLAKVYATILCKPTGMDTLHNALRNKRLRKVLSEHGPFEWVAFISEE